MEATDHSHDDPFSYRYVIYGRRQLLEAYGEQTTPEERERDLAGCGSVRAGHPCTADEFGEQ